MSLFNAYMALSGAYDAEIIKDERLSRRTSLRVGGPAALVAKVHSYPSLARVLTTLQEESVPWVVLGKGTNIIAADGGYDGCVLLLGREFSRIAVDEEASVMHVGAGALTAQAVNVALQCELSGIEMLAGIPGTLGGAVSQNAGSRHQWIGSCVRGVVCHVPGQGLCRLDGHDIEWSYRTSSIPATSILLEVELALDPSTKAQVSERIDRRLYRRKMQQPMGVATCGGIFCDTAHDSAANLIGRAGLKGKRFGAALISEAYPNHIVNEGGASAQDVLRLIDEMQTQVKEGSGVTLRPQVKFLGLSS